MENEIEQAIDATFEDFLKDYELDADGSISDMLYEFFAEGFIRALEHFEEEEEEEGGEGVAG